jgi:hypothetical protein
LVLVDQEGRLLLEPPLDGRHSTVVLALTAHLLTAHLLMAQLLMGHHLSISSTSTTSSSTTSSSRRCDYDHS